MSITPMDPKEYSEKAVALHQAIVSKDLKKVKEALQPFKEKGYHVDEINFVGHVQGVEGIENREGYQFLPLRDAIKHGNLAIVKFLIEEERADPLASEIYKGRSNPSTGAQKPRARYVTARDTGNVDTSLAQLGELRASEYRNWVSAHDRVRASKDTESLEIVDYIREKIIEKMIAKKSSTVSEKDKDIQNEEIGKGAGGISRIGLGEIRREIAQREAQAREAESTKEQAKAQAGDNKQAAEQSRQQAKDKPEQPSQDRQDKERP